MFQQNCTQPYKRFFFIYRFQEEIYTTSYLTGAYLKSIGFNKKVYLYGTRGIADELANFGIDSIGLGVSTAKIRINGTVTT